MLRNLQGCNRRQKRERRENRRERTVKQGQGGAKQLSKARAYQRRQLDTTTDVFPPSTRYLWTNVKVNLELISMCI